MEANKLYFWMRSGFKIGRNIVPFQLKSKIKESMVAVAIHNYTRQKNTNYLDDLEWGVNLIGSIYAEMGLGQSCRLVAHELEQSDHNFSIYNVDFDRALGVGDHTYEKYVSGKLPYRINLFHVNPGELANLFMQKSDMWIGHYNIAFWLWELEEFPGEWVKYCSLFDEIWTPSEFAGKGIRKAVNIPVSTVPYSVTVPVIQTESGNMRMAFGLPEGQFLYLIMYDSNSTAGRKNPRGAIDAYKKAFPVERKDCGLVIKINNVKKNDIKNLKRYLQEYKNVYFITEILEKQKVNSLIQNVNVLISLHRAEGFGLVMAEAMLLGTPVVATNWSANVEFMTKNAACMVDYELVSNKKNQEFYKKGCIWAEPDIDDAAKYIRRLKDDRIFYESKVEQGKLCINKKLNPEKVLQVWNEKIKEINLRYQNEG